ncbi:MAG TPA: hypothetical protein PK453_18105 [Leptospiraceae bacterium]|nr:hypothetical protein [Leptospiraceae bacterium]HMY68471.1 hypothetical protein [Leptospiraceae bacterium]HNF15584.1 hypothetical protein [Leptospiraceae bacterium]HNF26857.1 hypothetical protein [Leptospiraceae bacterium]HNI97192.1 hypothetical protein [Leptospiraceae bacterium]
MICTAVYFSSFFGNLHTETFSDLKSDDLYQSDFGRKIIQDSFRSDSAAGKAVSFSENFSLKNANYIRSRYFTQKGGERKDNSEKYGIFGTASPELYLSYDKGERKAYFLYSPLIYYNETYNLEKKVSSPVFHEILAGYSDSFGLLKTKVQAGQGLYRLDSYGFLFSGPAGFADLSLRISSLPFSLSFQNLVLNRRSGTLYRSADSEAGGAVLKKDKDAYFKSFQMMYFIYREFRNQTYTGFFPEDKKEFLPEGNFRYAGIELNSERFFRSEISTGAFTVKGKRDFRETDFNAHSVRKTDAYLGYLCLDFFFTERLSARAGGLRTSKDRNSRTDRRSNGFAGILSDPGIFGGHSSFLLSENISGKSPPAFRDLDSNSRPDFENKGLQMYSVSLNYNFEKNAFTGILNRAAGFTGTGYEFIFQWKYSSMNTAYPYYLLVSFCEAFLFSREENILLFSSEKTEKRREFQRIYFSLGTVF